MNRRDEIEAERRRAAEAALAGVARDAEVIGASGLARPRPLRDGLADHFSGADAPPDDAIEVWGRRIGRALAVVAAGALLVHLLFTWVLR